MGWTELIPFETFTSQCLLRAPFIAVKVQHSIVWLYSVLMFHTTQINSY